MASVPYLSLILPAYNEAKRIAQTLQVTQAYLDSQRIEHEIIVAADGNDGTRELVAQLGQSDPRLHVLGGPERGGKGRAIRLAVAQARGQFVGYMDADYKIPIEEIAKIWPGFKQGYDVVIGSRALTTSRIEVAQPFYRRLGSRLFAMSMHLAIGLREIRDTQCGFKFFRGDVARDLFRRQRIDGYMFDVEILRLALKSGYRIQEIGIRWHDDGDSRLNLVCGNLRNALDILRIRFGRTPQAA